jgi:hypothetical protein
LVFVFLYVYSSIILEKRAEQALPGSKGVEGRGRERGEGGWAGGRYGPNNVCTYE